MSRGNSNLLEKREDFWKVVGAQNMCSYSSESDSARRWRRNVDVEHTVTAVWKPGDQPTYLCSLRASRGTDSKESVVS